MYLKRTLLQTLGIWTIGCLLSFAHALPTLTPSSGIVSPAGQTFAYSANGTAVSNFVIYIGTGLSGPARFDLANSGGLGSASSSFSAPTLPIGVIYVTLSYRVSGSWQQDTYPFTVATETVGESLLSELNCGVDELIQTSLLGWECVDASSFQGPVGAEGPQGPQGPAGPAGPSVSSVAICSSGARSSPYGNPRSSCAAQCAGSSKVIAANASFIGGVTTVSSCRVQSELGECSAALRYSGPEPVPSTAGLCCVCSP